MRTPENSSVFSRCTQQHGMVIEVNVSTKIMHANVFELRNPELSVIVAPDVLMQRLRAAHCFADIVVSYK
jgi:hypothetical protein